MKFKANLWKMKLKMKLEYYGKGNYGFANQVITRSEMVIKKYGMLRKSFFKVYKSGWYQSMLLIRKLNWYLMEVQKTAKERMETLVARLLREYPAPDKEANPFAWVGNMNMLIAMAEECVINDLVYR